MASGGITIKQTGSFQNARIYIENVSNISSKITKILDHFGKEGLEELSRATPKRTGKTAASWTYSVKRDRNGISLAFSNENRSNKIPVVVLIVYGHVTKTGGWVEGRDFITPVVDPLFKDIQNQIREEVSKT